MTVSSVHGLTGVIGSLSIGICSNLALNPSGGANGWIYGTNTFKSKVIDPKGNPRLFGIQILAVVVVAAYSGVWTAIIAIILKKTWGLRVSETEEIKGKEILIDLTHIKGVDVTQHNEYAYHGLVLKRYDEHEEEDDEARPIVN